MKHSFVAAVVEVDKVLLELGGERGGVDSISVILGGDVLKCQSAKEIVTDVLWEKLTACSGGQVQSGNVVSSVTVLELNGAGANSQSQKLVAKADTHNGYVGCVHELRKVVHCLLAMGRVTRSVGDEDAVEVVSDLVDGVLVREDGDSGTSADETSHDVLLDTAVNQGDVELGIGRGDHEGSFRADALDEVDLSGVNKALVFVLIVLFTDGDAGERRTLFSEIGDDVSGVDTRDGGNALTSAPVAERLDGGPMGIFRSNISDYNTGALDVRRLKVLEEVVLVSLVGGDSVVADQGLCEDENLATVGRVGH